MSYTDIDILRTRLSEAKLVQLTDFENTGSANELRVSSALDYAAALIDSYAGGRYGLPLSASNQVKDLELSIAIYKLYEGRQLAPENIRQSYEDAVAFLKDVAKGSATLDQAEVTQTSQGGVVTRNHDTSPYVFETSRIEDFI